MFSEPIQNQIIGRFTEDINDTFTVTDDDDGDNTNVTKFLLLRIPQKESQNGGLYKKIEFGIQSH